VATKLLALRVLVNGKAHCTVAVPDGVATASVTVIRRKGENSTSSQAGGHTSFVVSGYRESKRLHLYPWWISPDSVLLKPGDEVSLRIVKAQPSQLSKPTKVNRSPKGSPSGAKRAKSARRR
jgi:hypothetical protein